MYSSISVRRFKAFSELLVLLIGEIHIKPLILTSMLAQQPSNLKHFPAEEKFPIQSIRGIVALPVFRNLFYISIDMHTASSFVVQTARI